jgi:uncharacterized membrane protein YgdD (TMEM256/DUF423 family)
MDRLFLTAAALFAFLAVGAGAFGAHALRQRIPPERMQTFETGVRYTLYHAFGLFAVVWFRTAGPDQLSETVAGIAFIAGIVLFGGSLAALSLTGERRWGAFTPIGGVCFLIGWAALIVAALTAPLDFTQMVQATAPLVGG